MQHINSFNAGMKRGIDNSLFPQDSYLNLRNGTLLKTERGLVVSNIRTDKDAITLGSTEYPIASCSFKNILYILTYTKPVSPSVYGTLKLYFSSGGSIVPLLNMISGGSPAQFSFSEEILGFNSSKLVEMIAKESYDGSTDLYLCNGIVPNIIINSGHNGIEYTSRKYNSTDGRSVFLQQKSISKIPTANYSVSANGSLKPGTYYIYLRYEDSSLNSTPFIKEVGPIHIHPRKSGLLNTGETINKRIVLTVSDVDTNYSYIGVGVVYLFGEDGLLSRENYMLDNQYSISNETTNIIIDGSNNIRPLLLEELLKDNIKQNSCETQSQMDGIWYGANWKGAKDNYNYLRKVASYMIPYAYLDTVSNFNNVYDENNNKHEYMEEEIYPLGVSFVIDGRYKTEVFPICGWNEGKDYNLSIGPKPSMLYNKLLTEQVYPGTWTVNTQNTELERNYFNLSVRENLGSYHVYGAFDSLLDIGEEVEISLRIYDVNQVDYKDAVVTITPDISNNMGTKKDIYGNPDVFLFTLDTIIPDLDDETTWIVKSFTPENNGYKCDDEGNSSISGLYWRYSTWYYYHDQRNYPIETKYVNIWLSRTYTPGYTSEALESEWDEVIEEIDNQKGLYSFPKKSQIENTNASHFKLLGLKIDYQWAKRYISEYVGDKPNITGFYIVHGDRQKNVITQGYSVAAVEAVGFDKEYSTTNSGGDSFSSIVIRQSTKLGSSNNDCAFPIIDGSNFRMFPILRFTREYRGMTYAERTWRLVAYAPSQLPVMNKAEIIAPLLYKSQTGNKQYYRYTQPTGNNNLLANNNYLNYINVFTNKFCIFTPDILLDRSMIINSNYYIKPVISLRAATVRPTTHGSSHPHISVQEKYCHAHSIWKSGNTTTEHYAYGDNMSRVVNPMLSDYIRVSTNKVYADTAIINENTISGLFHGFSTRMKSVIEVFGEDYKNISDVTSSTILSAFALSRTSLYNAGILINRFKVDTDDDSISEPIHVSSGLHETNVATLYSGAWPFQNRNVLPFDNHWKDNGLMVVASNLSMKSTPYIGVKTEDEGYYLNYPDAAKHDYRNLHNCIVNVCTYNNFEDYLSDVLNKYNILVERYRIVSDGSFNDDEHLPIFRGDLFSQKTYMRCVRWMDRPDTMYDIETDIDWSYSWKQGQAIHLYLQSFTNSNLRVPGPDETFYPYLLDDSSTNPETDFVWKSEKINYLKESWKYNDGYHQLMGVFRLPAFDTLFEKQSFISSNRVRFSNKHISGAFVDAYREILIENYQDFAFENGEILRLVRFNNALVSIQTNGIIQHYQNSKLEVSGDTSEIITGDRSALSDNYRQISDYGTQHKDSVCIGDSGIYGVDWKKNSIWRIKPTATQTGSIYYGFEDLIVGKSLFGYIENIKYDGMENMLQNIYGDPSTGIISTYNERTKEVYFTFHLQYVSVGVTVERYKTLVFSELYDTFVSEYDYNACNYMKNGSQLYMFKRGSSKIHEVQAGTGYSNSLPLELEFIVNARSEENNASEFEKEFKAHLINSVPELYDFIEWTTEYQYSKKEPFIDNNAFWSNPEYVEHVWRVPILPNTKNPITGPLGTTEFNTFEQDSQMRGQWIKVKLKYTGPNGNAKEIVIRNIITNFIISY